MDAELRRLKKLLILFGVVTLLLLVGFVVFVSLELRHLKSQITQPVTTEKVIEKSPLNIPSIAELKGEPGKTVIGPQGLQGEKGAQGLPGKDGQNGIDGKDGRDGKDGANAREIELCKLAVTHEIGQRFVGTSICLPIEVIE